MLWPITSIKYPERPRLFSCNKLAAERWVSFTKAFTHNPAIIIIIMKHLYAEYTGQLQYLLQINNVIKHHVYGLKGRSGVSSLRFLT